MNDDVKEILDYFQKDVDKYEESKKYLMEKYGYDEETIDNISQHKRHINTKILLDYITNLQEENKRLKEVIDKIDKYINDYNVFEVFSFPLMKRWEEEQVKSSIDYEFKTSLIKYLKDILKEVE